MYGLQLQRMRLLFWGVLLFTSEIVTSNPISPRTTDQATLSKSDLAMLNNECHINPENPNAVNFGVVSMFSWDFYSRR